MGSVWWHVTTPAECISYTCRELDDPVRICSAELPLGVVARVRAGRYAPRVDVCTSRSDVLVSPRAPTGPAARPAHGAPVSLITYFGLCATPGAAKAAGDVYFRRGRRGLAGAG